MYVFMYIYVCVCVGASPSVPALSWWGEVSGGGISPCPPTHLRAPFPLLSTPKLIITQYRGGRGAVVLPVFACPPTPHTHTHYNTIQVGGAVLLHVFGCPPTPLTHTHYNTIQVGGAVFLPICGCPPAPHPHAPTRNPIMIQVGHISAFVHPCRASEGRTHADGGVHPLSDQEKDGGGGAACVTAQASWNSVEALERSRSKSSPLAKTRSKLANPVELSWGFDRFRLGLLVLTGIC